MGKKILKHSLYNAATWVVGLLILAGSFIFFQFFYLYHLFYREQTQLFLYTSEYLSSYFQHPAWIACLAGDFLTQFFYYITGGAAVLSILLATVYILSEKALKNFLPRWLALLFGMIVALWELLRNCELNYLTSSTISLIGGIGLFLIYNWTAKKFLSKSWANLLVVIICILAGYWMFGYGAVILSGLMLIRALKQSRWLAAVVIIVEIAVLPLILCHVYLLTTKQAYNYPSRNLTGYPNWDREQLLALDCETYFGHYGKVTKLAEKSGKRSAAVSYFYNLANCMQGQMPDKLINFYQPINYGLILQVGPNTPFLHIFFSNEVWYQVGEMTMAEHAAMLGEIFSPNHRSARMVRRLAEINLITGDDEAAKKYLRMLSHTLCYRKWAADSWPGKQSKSVAFVYDNKRKLAVTSDSLHRSDNAETALRSLLVSHPENTKAQDYLFCYELLLKDVKSFMTDYTEFKMPSMSKGEVPSPFYQQALLVYLANSKQTDAETLRHYRISPGVWKDFVNYTQRYEQSHGDGKLLQYTYGQSYWFYYHFAKFQNK
ncbi:DUF6057 family protein [uncultured Bacteroides sp.]|uniref:DUF6057 family protein n=1 Tax=uncultured Bacteroides sp. TaxID=162156 RepID=UPI002AAA7EB3|nr:DUF6057 family protein [uncultured Bacteroides sp.]